MVAEAAAAAAAGSRRARLSCRCRPASLAPRSGDPARFVLRFALAVACPSSFGLSLTELFAVLFSPSLRLAAGDRSKSPNRTRTSETKRFPPETQSTAKQSNKKPNECFDDQDG
jgi:hypothetical protein